MVGLLLLDSVGGSPDDSGRGFVGRCCGSLAGFCLESVAVVALSLDSLWSSWILFGGVALVFMIRAGRGMHPPGVQKGC